MTAQQSRLEYYVEIIQRANQIAATTELGALLDQMLALAVEVTGARLGTLYIYDAERDALAFKSVCSDAANWHLLGLHIPADTGLAGHVLREGTPRFVHDLASDPHWDTSFGELPGVPLHSAYCLPLMLRDKPLGIVQLFNLPSTAVDESDEIAILNLLCGRLTTEIEKAQLLEAAQHRERRQHALVEIISRITSTLEHEELLKRIMSYATDLLNVEATSIWLRDDTQGDLVLHLATGEQSGLIQRKRVPAGHGVIGHVVDTGKMMLVNNVREDGRFYRQIDEQSGFITRSILCVPLRAPHILLGGERGEIEEVIIGGAQALNPRDQRDFDAEDCALFETFASQAATVIRLSKLYRETDTLFSRIIDAITGAIDLKDPYTRGHSQRVSDFSVAIAQELDLPSAVIYRVRVASKLHDVGKIRVPDSILKKRGRLDEAERREMQLHPTYGYEFLKENRLLDIELLSDSWQALAQHHERLDGGGYPAGLRGDEISLIGRIVAVADVFDAITSHRPYRAALSSTEALRILQAGAGSEFDARCVAALVRAREKGLVRVQDERNAV